MRVLASFAVLAMCACSHPLLLKKYAATSPAVEGLKGRTIFVSPFLDERKRDWSASEPLADPSGWEFRELTDQQLDAWDTERQRLEETTPLPKQTQVGHKRNGFGVPIQEVFALNSPAQWLTDATRLELQAQGVIAATGPESADLVVQAVVRHVWLDLYMATWVHVVLDVTTTVRGAPPKTVRLHAAEAKVAWSGGDAESFEIFCAAEQKLQRYLLKEIARALTETPPGPQAL